MALLLILSLLLTEAAADLVTVEEVKEGDTAILNCNVSRTPIRAVEWLKDDKPQKFILFYSDGHYHPDRQDSIFNGRAELADRELKGGNLTLLLKNVTVSDAGTYQCLVATGVSRRSKRAAYIKDEPVRTIQLEVRGSANENSMNENSMNEHLGRSFVGSVAGFVLLLAVVFGGLLYKRHLVKRSNDDGPVNDRFIKHSEEQQNPESSP